jgi:hypothetical protein
VTEVNPARNKARGKQDERDVARIMGGERHPADTGGDEDVSHPLFAIQVKGGKTVVTQVMRDGMASAQRAAGDKLPALVTVDRRGTRLQRWITFPLDDFMEWLKKG